jgi:hypothetical protein
MKQTWKQVTAMLLLWVVAALAGLSLPPLVPPVYSQAPSRLFIAHPTTGVSVPVQGDPCGPNSSVAKLGVVVNAAVDTELVAAAAGTTVYVCGFSVVAAGTTPTFRLISGTGSVCGTNTVGLTGIYAPTAGILVQAGQGGITITKTTSAQALCIDVGGTPSIQGVLTYALLT